jgi:2-polyprenyl-6-methoxyphenol hydroxylase-like FAD-dependent oxidoreductase
LPRRTQSDRLIVSLSIAVGGGGLSGLVLARILQQHNIACTVYELDATAHARRQGGLLDLHVDSGQMEAQQCLPDMVQPEEVARR